VRIEEAQDRGQLGEAEGRKADLAAAKDKLAQMDYIAASRRATVDLGMPAFSQAPAQTITASSNPDDT
jgi:hypothetical protein